MVLRIVSQHINQINNYYESGGLELERNYKDDEIHGPFREWRENGKLWKEFNFENGERVSLKMWDENGKLDWEENYQNEKMTSVN